VSRCSGRRCPRTFRNLDGGPDILVASSDSTRLGPKRVQRPAGLSRDTTASPTNAPDSENGQLETALVVQGKEEVGGSGAEAEAGGMRCAEVSRSV